jgi:molecular chaperone GrpE
MVDQEQNASSNANREGNSPDTPESQENVAFDSAANPKQVLIKDEELRALQKELLEYKDKYLRLLADAENARKRLQKERQEISRYAIENLVVDFLRPLDNFENALRFAQEMSDEVRNWAFGFQMILTQFKDVLSQHGIMPFDSVGKPFNPHDQEAIEMVETTDQPAGIILEESVRGYKMGDRTIRAARVKVAKPPEKSAKASEQNQNKNI